MEGPEPKLASRVRVGTASWTDPEFIKAGWYPDGIKNDSAARLRYYADHLDMVEVNASFYALPTIETVENWDRRTPEGFRFHVKAHQVISGHPCDPGRLPPPLRELPATLDKKGRIRRPSRELRDAVIDSLLEAASTLGEKLGAILLQLPPFVVAGDAQRQEVARIIDRLAPARTAFEPRHRSWVEPGELEPTLELLAERDAAWVVVDAPDIEVASALPAVLECTSPALGYIRLHGRNKHTWTRGRSVAEKYDYAYSDEEIASWLDPALELARQAQEVAVVFNNNARDYALRNAQQFRELLKPH
ncbi:MAG: DUF72 domain-containing protein [Thermoleophilia bacterium]|nr:DUF72 domain-containing protein [Thermoleophilia bacterium]